MVRFSLVLAAVCGFGAPAFAQETEAAATLDCTAAETQMDMNTCAQMDFADADANLNAAYKAAVARMQALDAAMTDKGAEAALRAAQQTWITFRDQACAAEGWAVHGGSIEPMVVLECKARLSSARADDLWSLSETGL